GCLDAVYAKASILDTFPAWNKTWTRKEEVQLTLKEQYITYWNSVKRDSILNQIDVESERILNLLYSEEDTYYAGQGDLVQYGFSNKVFELQKTLILRRVWFAIWFKSLPNGELKKKNLAKHTKDVYNKMVG